MASDPNKLSQFWQELKRRKVIPFLIGYVAACFAIIEFFINTSERYSISDATLDLIYILAAAGLPVVIILPWIIKRKKHEPSPEEIILQEIVTEKKVKKALHNLPAHLSSFIGREEEIETIKQLLSENRLVTITGSGGCGKTRLAIQSAAAVLTNYSDGVWMVELAPITVPDHIDQAIAEIFKIKEQPGSILINIITHYLKNKKLLLILDNCEHLIDACSEIVEQILKSTEDVTILNTSREALNIADELAWRAPSLSLPENGKELSANEVNQYEAVQLFVARAKNKQPEFNLSDQNAKPVLQICNRLDGIPLAIELAASRINVFNPELIVSKLDDRFRLLTGGSRTALERHKTLQATLDWSYDLLSDNEKKIYHQLSVFVGGFDLEAYEYICKAPDEESEDLMNLLTSLVEKSLVITKTMKNGDYRYQLLETIRHYAKEKLLESGDSESVRESHYQHYYKLSEQAYIENFRKFEYWADWLELEHQNIIAALEWVRNDKEKLLRLAGVLGWFWYERSHYGLGIDFLQDVENFPAESILTKARAMTGYGWLLMIVGDPKGIPFIDNSFELWNKLKNKQEKVKGLFLYSFTKSVMQDYETAEDVATEIKEIAEELKDDFLLLRAKTAQTFVHICQLQVDSAEPLAAQNLKDALALDDNILKAWNLHFYSDCALMRKDYKETEQRYAIAMKRWLENGNEIEAVTELGGMVFGLSGQGRYLKALRLQGAADAKFDEFGGSAFPVKFWTDWVEEYVNGARRAVGEKEAILYEQEGREMGFEKVVEYALDFEMD
jgi:predicted ATPase